MHGKNMGSVLQSINNVYCWKLGLPRISFLFVYFLVLLRLLTLNMYYLYN